VGPAPTFRFELAPADRPTAASTLEVSFSPSTAAPWRPSSLRMGTLRSRSRRIREAYEGGWDVVLGRLENFVAE